MIQGLLSALAVSLAMTLVLEVGYFLLTGKRDKKDLLLVVMVNILTNPVVVLTYWLVALYTNWNLIVVIIPLELLAVFVEGLHYKKYGNAFKRPYRFSLAANVFSYGMGLLIQMLI